MPRVVHFEILADDPARAGKFYQDVFGWDIQTWEGPEVYSLVTTGPDSVPGINGGIMGRHFNQPVSNTIQVESLADAIAQVEGAGGTKIHGPSEIPGIGFQVYCTDTEGNIFGIHQSLEG